MYKHLYILLIIAGVLAGCNNKPAPEKKEIGEIVFTTAYSTFYGTHYASRGIKQNVVDLDLYSEKIGLDSTHHIVGTGTNLYFSDIFLPSDLTALQAEEYASDTTGAEYSFLPGVDYEGNISGAYLLRINDGKLSGYTVFDEGRFVLTQDGDSTHISFSLKYTEGRNMVKTYEAEFHGILVAETAKE